MNIIFSSLMIIWSVLYVAVPVSATERQEAEEQDLMSKPFFREASEREIFDGPFTSFPPELFKLTAEYLPANALTKVWKTNTNKAEESRELLVRRQKEQHFDELKEEFVQKFKAKFDCTDEDARTTVESYLNGFDGRLKRLYSLSIQQGKRDDIVEWDRQLRRKLIRWSSPPHRRLPAGTLTSGQLALFDAYIHARDSTNVATDRVFSVKDTAKRCFCRMLVEEIGVEVKYTGLPEYSGRDMVAMDVISQFARCILKGPTPEVDRFLTDSDVWGSICAANPEFLPHLNEFAQIFREFDSKKK